tara:strand:- start:21939 stop:22358 length:420 start_codon:yes stop_codon:yes gene_type:complete
MGVREWAIIGSVLAVLGLSAWLRITHLQLDAMEISRDAWKRAETDCKLDAKTVEEVSREFENAKVITDRKLRDMRRLLDNTHIPITKPSSVRNAASADGELRGQGVGQIGADWIINFAEDAEDVRQRFIGCQNYLAKIR